MSVYNNTHHKELGTSPSLFLLNNRHDIKNKMIVSTDEKLRWREGHRNFVSFRIGSKVLKKRVLKGRLNVNKLEDKYDGPFTVEKVNENKVTYLLTMNGKKIRAHHKQMKLWHEAPSYLTANTLFKRFYKCEREGASDGNDVVNDLITNERFVGINDSLNESFSSMSSSDSLSSGDTIIFSLPQNEHEYSVHTGSTVIVNEADEHLLLHERGTCVGCGYFLSDRISKPHDVVLKPLNETWNYSALLPQCFSTPNPQRSFLNNNSSDNINKLETVIDEFYNKMCSQVEVQKSNITGDESDKGSSSCCKEMEVSSDALVSRYQLRSKGTVMDLPRIQPRILERVYKC